MTARVSITSPRSNMPGSYRSSTPTRRGSYAGLSSSYSTTYGNTYNKYSTGATTGSYTRAASKFEKTPAYTPSTNYASKPPAYQARSRITSPSPSRTTGRPLPAGPGPLDRYGNKISVNEAVGTFRSTVRSRASTPTRSRPLKADHTYSSSYNNDYSSSSRTYSPSTYQDDATPRLGRSKRTNSITDLSRGVDNINISGSIRNSRLYGSTADLNGNVSTSKSTYNRDYKEDSVDDIYNSSSNKSTPTKTYTQKTYLNNKHNDSLPDINDRPNSATRSPSVDKTSKKRESRESSVEENGTSWVGRKNSINNNYYNRVSPDTGSSKGLVGLRNLGNTCFMSSIIQCLSNTPGLRDYCINDDWRMELNTETSSMKGALIKSFSSLLKTMWSKSADSSVSPTDFKEKISKFAPRFIGYNQQDAQEILVYLLEGLHEDLNRKKKKKKRVIDCDDGVVTTPAVQLAERAWKNYVDVDDSKIIDLFSGQLRSALTCTVCGYVSNTFDMFQDLSLPIKKARYGSSCTLQDCFELFTQEEVLDGDERPTCAQCKKRQKCTKRFSIQKFPEYLIIHLKRFNQDSYYRSKLSTLVDFPLHSLDLSPYTSDACSSNRGSTYDLYAVSNHSGTPFGGHYTAYAKNQYSNQWHHFNDQRVSSISATRVVSSEGYVLFYHRSGGGGGSKSS